jgi:predicted DCC family thiol-disulfide oxidoreductase YuxK
MLMANQSTVFFDDSCLLCNRFVKVLLNYDRQKLYYSGFKSRHAQDILQQSLLDDPQTLVFYQGEEILLQSRAIFKIINNLRFPLNLFRVFSVLPTSLTDCLYRWTARHRALWFGRSKNCLEP